MRKRNNCYRKMKDKPQQNNVSGVWRELIRILVYKEPNDLNPLFNRFDQSPAPLPAQSSLLLNPHCLHLLSTSPYPAPTHSLLTYSRPTHPVEALRVSSLLISPVHSTPSSLCCWGASWSQLGWAATSHGLPHKQSTVCESARLSQRKRFWLFSCSSPTLRISRGNNCHLQKFRFCWPHR